MKHFSFLKNFSIACLALASVAGMNSCTHSSVSRAANLLQQERSNAKVYSYNDACSPALRQCKFAGPLPERTASALATWLHHSTAKHFSYAYPQYYLSFVTPNGRQSVWGLCSDAHGNFVGIMIPRNGVPAWDIPFACEQTLFVCDDPQHKALSEAIMDSLKEYDSFRIESRRSAGLTNWNYLISAPTDENAKRLAKFKEAQAQAEAAKAKNAENSMQDASSGSDSDLDLDSFGSDDDDMSLDTDDSSSDEDSSDSDDSSSDSDDSSSDEDDSEE